MALHTGSVVASVFVIAGLESSWMRAYSTYFCAMTLFAGTAVLMASLAGLKIPARFRAMLG